MPVSDPAQEELPDMVSSGPDGIAFFHAICRWREQLARSIARNNLALHSIEIATATNRIVLGLVFLRMAEDRGCIPEGTLAGFCGPAGSSFPVAGLLPYTAVLYRNGDPQAGPEPERYGSLVVDDRVISSVFRDITSPDRKYDFAVMDTEIAAQAFSRYLSRTVRRSAAHQAMIVDTHDTVLSHGTVIPSLPAIRYMAERATGSAWEDRSIRDPLPLRVLDPACGPGGVLLAAYRRLLAIRGTMPAPEERLEILFQSIHGVDISPHAVAVARMLLFFQSLGGRRPPQPARDFLASADSIFRVLCHTIRCGNSLIGPEIARDESWMFCPVRERHRLSPFAWHDQFPEVRAAGGFDAVIGNPPEGPVEEREWIQQYFQRHYATYHPAADRSAFFIEKGISLLRKGGTLSFVMNTRWLRGDGGSPLREFLLTRQVVEIAEFPNTDLCTIRIRNAAPRDPLMVVRGDPRSLLSGSTGTAGEERFPVDLAGLGSGGWALCDTREEALLAKIQRAGTPFGQSCLGEVGCGAVKPFDERLVLGAREREQLVKRDRRSAALIRPYIAGSRIGRYHAGGPGEHLLFLPAGWMEESALSAKKSVNRWFRERYPAIARHLKDLAPESVGQVREGSAWFEVSCREVFRTRALPKILFPCRCILPVFTYDEGAGVIDRGAGYIVTSSLYLLGVLNSRLARFWFARQQKNSPGPIVTADALTGFFVPTPDFDNPEEIARHARIGTLARKMLVYNGQLARETDETAREQLRKRITRTDRQIDLLVYALYGLTPEEIAVAESIAASFSPS